MRSIFTVGIPTPTGTLCPSLPQVPMPSSSRRSLPTMLTYFNASGPLPISVALRTGRVSLPSAEIHAVKPLGHGADDVLRIALARHHERIGHARHGNVRIAFAPPAA